jgi:hypothetical protein
MQKIIPHITIAARLPDINAANSAIALTANNLSIIYPLQLLDIMSTTGCGINGSPA